MLEFIKNIRRREVQMLGAALSKRDWHEMENAYNQLRDKIDAKLIEASVNANPNG